MTSATPPPDIRLKPGTSLPVSAPFTGRLYRALVLHENAAQMMQRNAQTYGDLVASQFFGLRFLQFNHPELVQEMLVRDEPLHHRGLVMQRSKAVLGESLLTSEEPLHMRQRRLAQPAFHRQRIAAYGEIIGNYSVELTQRWRPNTVVDMRAEMLHFALRVVGKTLFDFDSELDTRRFSTAVDAFQSYLPLALLPFGRLVERLPVPAMRRMWNGQRYLDDLIYRLIRERRADPTDRGDLLSLLLAATDPEARGPDVLSEDARMSDKQVRDECLTVLLAGHETTANALSFALWLLAERPEVQTQVADEAAQALGGRAPVAADYARLPLTERVFAEVMRLYPPVWATARMAAVDYEYRGMVIRKGTALLAPQFAIHRDPRFYPDPLRFDPSRFTAGAKAERPKLAYFPFGAGSRQCIGEGLAWMEGVLSLAAMVQGWRFAKPADAPPTIALAPAITLRPKHPVMLHIEPRG